jgi:arylformamidase
MKVALSLCLVGMGSAVSGCGLVQRAGIALVYKRADLPAAQVRDDIPYGDPALPLQRLDLFLAQGRDRPVFIFVHGGGWMKGDKGLRVGGADVYGNIGRFYAAHGVDVAVINYRLQPKASWRDQIDDVARATAWVHAHIADDGGDPRRLFIGGHSAGAPLAARVALDPAPLARYGLSPSNICGVITVSGAGLDMADQQTYALGASPAYYQRRFGNGTADWQREASPVSYIRPGAPPFLILYAAGETKSLQRQSRRFAEVLAANSVPHQTTVIPGQSHTRIVLTLSRADETAGPAILNFIQTTMCHGSPRRLPGLYLPSNFATMNMRNAPPNPPPNSR